MTDLPIIQSPSASNGSLRPAFAALVRCVLILSIAVGLRLIETRRSESIEFDADAVAIDMNVVSELLPGAFELTEATAGFQSVLDSEGQKLALIAQTQPAAKAVIGYRGPSNVALLMDDKSAVVAAFLIDSGDTPEHVAAIVNDSGFFGQFRGWRLGEPDTFSDIDATTGATLTSLAIAESVAVRLGGEKPSLRFPNDLNTDDLKLVFEDAEGMTLTLLSSVEAEVFDAEGKKTGTLIRTGPLVDSIAGYQGPTELLMAKDTAGGISRIALRTSYDNEPYTGYLNEEPYFWKAFLRDSTTALSELDIESERIEGVSGATMTSIAVAETLVAAAREYDRRQQAAANRSQQPLIHWSDHDTSTALILLGAIMIGTSRLRGIHGVSVVWNIILLVYFGLITGNLISLAVLTGWSAKGFAWRLAPGLSAVVVVSLVFPAATKRNLYCTHICPHGAAQQLLRKVSTPRWKLPRIWSRRLQWIPGMTLLLAIIVTAVGTNWNLAAWEPFNAYIWYVAGAGSIVIAVLSLLFSAVIPMGYCRYGCGTGRLLDYIRRSARSDRFHLADLIAFVIAVALWTHVGFN